PDVALEAIALNIVRRDRKLVAGLGIEAEIGLQLVGQPAGEFDPRRMVEQWHAETAPGKLQIRSAAPILPDVEAPIRLPHHAVGVGNGPLPAHPETAGGAISGAEGDCAEAIVRLVEIGLLPDDLRLRLEDEVGAELR